MTQASPPSRQNESSERPRQQAVHVLALAASVWTLVMLMAGGQVTSMGAGDAEPEWSLNFLAWFRPLHEMPGGLKIELGHRMIGTVLGFLVIALVMLVWRQEKGRLIRVMACSTLACVMAQGLLGGLRVRIISSEWLQDAMINLTGWDYDKVMPVQKGISILHAVFGQIIFCMMVALALMTSCGWKQRMQAMRSNMTGRMRGLCVVTLALTFCQIVLGAVCRHTQWDVMWHVMGAFVVLLHMMMLSHKLKKHFDPVFPMRQPAGLLIFIVCMQMALGMFAWGMTAIAVDFAPPVSLVALVRTGHQVTGAMILAILTVITLRSFRLLEHDAGPKMSQSIAGACQT